VAQAQISVRTNSVAHDPRRSLRVDSVRFIGTVGSAVGIQALTGGVTFLPALMAGVVGAAGPLAFGLAIVAMLFVAYAFITFTRDSSSAGSVYAYNGRAMGPAYGFLSVWALIGVYIAYASSVYCSNANRMCQNSEFSRANRCWRGLKCKFFFEFRGLLALVLRRMIGERWRVF